MDSGFWREGLHLSSRFEDLRFTWTTTVGKIIARNPPKQTTSPLFYILVGSRYGLGFWVRGQRSAVYVVEFGGFRLRVVA